jgi:hypothetical protein
MILTQLLLSILIGYYQWSPTLFLALQIITTCLHNTTHASSLHFHSHSVKTFKILTSNILPSFRESIHFNIVAATLALDFRAILHQTSSTSTTTGCINQMSSNKLSSHLKHRYKPSYQPKKENVPSNLTDVDFFLRTPLSPTHLKFHTYQWYVFYKGTKAPRDNSKTSHLAKFCRKIYQHFLTILIGVNQLGTGRFPRTTTTSTPRKRDFS